MRATGRSVNLLGKVQAASTGTISTQQIDTRPILRPGEVLEAIPGLVISQHSGGGKANQYYLRGFQLDHGTNLEATINGVPVNLPTHAHGQGYSDINWLIPEVVSFVEFKKGTYYADQGDFSTAGSYNLFFKNTIKPTFSVTVGGYGYNRFFLANSPRFGSGNLLYALEYVHDNSTLMRPDNYRKFNGLLRYSHNTTANEFNLTAMGYSGNFESSDQIPQRLVDDGSLDRFGLIDPSDGGKTSRMTLSAQIAHHDLHGTTRASAYGYEQQLNLFSNFTYFVDDASDYFNVTANPITCNPAYNTCAPGSGHVSTYTSYCAANNSAPGGAPVGSVTPAAFAFSCGDQREQEDKRFVSGFDLSRVFEHDTGSSLVGVSLRNDNIHTVGLYLDRGRARYPLGTLGSDHAIERDIAAYAQTEVHAGSRLRLTGGLRADAYTFDIRDVDPRNSGKVRSGIISPKFSAAYRLNANSEVYADYGQGFHSNDGRGLTQTVDPQTHASIDPGGNPVQSVTPLDRAAGEEIGYRYTSPKLVTTLALFQLNLASELIFDGDHGVTFAGRPTVRKGVEVSNFYRPTEHLTFDADLATSTARFLSDLDHIGTAVPESLAAVIAAGATVDEPYYSASLRLRYFGPRTLVEDGSAQSPPSLIFNTKFTAKLAHDTRLSFDVLNLLDARAADVTYYYGSWLPRDAAIPGLANDPTVNPALGGSGVSDYHFHPSERRTFRLSLSAKL